MLVIGSSISLKVVATREPYAMLAKLDSNYTSDLIISSRKSAMPRKTVMLSMADTSANDTELITGELLLPTLWSLAFLKSDRGVKVWIHL